MMKKGLLLSLCCFNLITANLNADEVVDLEEDINITKIASSTDSRKDDDVQFALEIGAKTDIWNPGLSEEDGQYLLKYDTEGLYLGYATLKTKIHNTDVFTFEKFSTLASSNNQKELLSEYKNDKKRESSIDGYKFSIHLMKILDYWFDSDFLTGLEYRYKTRNFIGEAELQRNALYWFGKEPGVLEEDYFSYKEGSKLSFKTKFTDNRLVYNVMRGALSLGVFDTKWSKPTSIGEYSESGDSIIFPAKYEVRGISLGIAYREKNRFGGLFEGKSIFDYGIDSSIYINDNKKVDDIELMTFGVDLIYIIPKIYSSRYLNLDFIIKGGYHQTKASQDEASNIVDKETLYSVQTALEFTF
jgi:hypothetical protein